MPLQSGSLQTPVTDFAVAGILWGLTGAWFGDATRGYPVFFG